MLHRLHDATAQLSTSDVFLIGFVCGVAFACVFLTAIFCAHRAALAEHEGRP